MITVLSYLILSMWTVGGLAVFCILIYLESQGVHVMLNLSWYKKLTIWIFFGPIPFIIALYLITFGLVWFWIFKDLKNSIK